MKIIQMEENKPVLLPMPKRGLLSWLYQLVEDIQKGRIHIDQRDLCAIQTLFRSYLPSISEKVAALRSLAELTPQIRLGKLAISKQLSLNVNDQIVYCVRNSSQLNENLLANLLWSLIYLYNEKNIFDIPKTTFAECCKNLLMSLVNKTDSYQLLYFALLKIFQLQQLESKEWPLLPEITNLLPLIDKLAENPSNTVQAISTAFQVLYQFSMHNGYVNAQILSRKWTKRESTIVSLIQPLLKNRDLPLIVVDTVIKSISAMITQNWLSLQVDLTPWWEKLLTDLLDLIKKQDIPIVSKVDADLVGFFIYKQTNGVEFANITRMIDHLHGLAKLLYEARNKADLVTLTFSSEIVVILNHLYQYIYKKSEHKKRASELLKDFETYTQPIVRIEDKAVEKPIEKIQAKSSPAPLCYFISDKKKTPSRRTPKRRRELQKKRKKQEQQPLSVLIVNGKPACIETFSVPKEVKCSRLSLSIAAALEQAEKNDDHEQAIEILENILEIMRTHPELHQVAIESSVKLMLCQHYISGGILDPEAMRKVFTYASDFLVSDCKASIRLRNIFLDEGNLDISQQVHQMLAAFIILKIADCLELKNIELLMPPLPEIKLQTDINELQINRVPNPILLYELKPTDLVPAKPKREPGQNCCSRSLQKLNSWWRGNWNKPLKNTPEEVRSQPFPGF